MDSKIRIQWDTYRHLWTVNEINSFNWGYIVKVWINISPPTGHVSSYELVSRSWARLSIGSVCPSVRGGFPKSICSFQKTASKTGRKDKNIIRCPCQSLIYASANTSHLQLLLRKLILSTSSGPFCYARLGSCWNEFGTTSIKLDVHVWLLEYSKCCVQLGTTRDQIGRILCTYAKFKNLR